MSSVKVTIPPLTFCKIFLRGVIELSCIREAEKQIMRMKVGERRGLKTARGVVTYFEKKSETEAILLTAYHVGREEEPIGQRAEALMGLLLNRLN